MDRKTFWAGGALVGAGLMALFDPNRGRRRRALLRDKATGAADVVGTAAGKTWRDLRNRAEGVAARGRGLFDHEVAGSDALAARVRSRIGRLTSHPHAISVEARDGAVVLSGPIIAREAEGVIAGVRAVRGVVSVEDRLELHESAEGVPALQGPGRRRPRGLLRENWSPTARLLGGAAGAGLIVAGARRRGWLGGAMAVAGLGLLSRAATNRPARRLLRLARSRANVEVRKEISIAAPISEVYAFWQRWENFPRFFEHVRDVRDEGGGWTRWTVAGPAGVEILFDAVVTAAIPNHLIAWKTGPRQAVRHAGLIRFEEISPGLTRVDVQMSYDPPAGQLGHAVAALFGTDPKSALDDDLLRLKSLLEDRKTTAHGSEVGLEGTRAEAGSAPFLGESQGGTTPPQSEAPAPREESLEPRPEEAIVAAQDAGIEPLIQTEPGQAAETPSADVAPAAEAETEKPSRRRSRKRRPEGTDQPDF